MARPGGSLEPVTPEPCSGGAEDVSPISQNEGKIYRQLALDLQQRLDAIHNSKIWRLLLACDLARRSFRDALRLPGRVWRILTADPSAVAAASVQPPLGSRQSSIVGWPADKPLITVVILSNGDMDELDESIESVHSSSLQDYEILVVDRETPQRQDVRASQDSAPDSAERRNQVVEAAQGKYIALLRAGDRVGETFFEKTAFALEEHPDAALAYAMTDEQEQSHAFHIQPAQHDAVPSGALFRREVWTETHGFRTGAALDVSSFRATIGLKGWRSLFLAEPLIHLKTDANKIHGQKLDIDPEAVLETRRADAPRAMKINAQPAVRTDGAAAQNVAFQQRTFLDFASEKPAILCIVPWLDIGGAEQVVLQIMRGLSKRFSFIVVATQTKGGNRAAEFRAVTPWVYDLPESHNAEPGKFLAELASRHGIRAALISSCEAGYRALPALKQRGMWVADIVHNTASEGHLGLSIRYRRLLDVHFACGRLQGDALQRGGVEASRIQTAWTSVDTSDRFNPERYRDFRASLRGEFGLDEGDTVITYVGRLSIEKDVPLFVSAVAEIIRRHPELRIRALIAGEGPERLHIEQLIENGGVWNEVRMLGDSRRVPEILSLSDYLMLTSKTEGSPITILEAMSLELVVLSTNVGNVASVIENGVNGFVIDGRKPSTFAERFDEMQRDPERQARMRQAARRTIVERFDESRFLNEYDRILRAALGTARAKGSE